MLKLINAYIVDPTPANALKIQKHFLKHPLSTLLLNEYEQKILHAALKYTRPAGF